MAGQFEGKVVVVTGASSGIGRASAIAFAREGAKVVVCARRTDRGERTVNVIEEAGGTATFVRADVSKLADVKAMVDKTLGTYGGLDCAFNNAGIEGPSVPIVEYPEEDWHRVIDTNLKGVWLCMKYEIQYMQDHGGVGGPL
jgi:NAD(P)-dependent dehydrogenase (short-subunit alcohol dehydrogenase family)